MKVINRGLDQPGGHIQMRCLIVATIRIRMHSRLHTIRCIYVHSSEIGYTLIVYRCNHACKTSVVCDCHPGLLLLSFVLLALFCTRITTRVWGLWQGGRVKS